MDASPMQLAFIGHAHSAAVRCCCVLSTGLLLTGSLDTTVVAWQQHEQQQQQVGVSTGDTAAAAPASSNGTLTSSSNSSSSNGGGGAEDCVGCMYNPSKGHGATICSVSESGEKVASGDWGGEARVWNRDSAEVLFVLKEGHAFAAVTVCWLPGMLVSGSQNKKLCFWRKENGKNIRVVEDAHADIIRSLAALPADTASKNNSSNSSSSSKVVSVSNDRSVKVWDGKGRCLAVKEEAHQAFVFHCCVSPTRPGCVYTSGDDGVCCLWRFAASSLSPLQRMQHPATVWQAVELPSGDVATCCEDARLRVWTADEVRALPADVVAANTALHKPRDTAEGDEETGEEIDLHTLPTEEEVCVRRTHPKLECLPLCLVCRRGDAAVVFCWQQQQQQWDFVGLALNPVKGKGKRGHGGKTRFPGDQFFGAGDYDFVFDVEVGEGSLLCGVCLCCCSSLDENPLVVAEKFAAREGLHKSVLPQIVSFIQNNTGAANLAAAAAASVSNSSSSSSRQKHLPALECISFAKANLEGIEKGILSAQQFLKDAAHPAQLSELDAGYLFSALRKFSSTNFLKEKFRDSEVHVLMVQLSFFPPHLQLPVLDLWRLFSLHPLYSLAAKKSQNHGWEFVVVAFNRIKETLAAAASQEHHQQQLQQQQLPAGLVLCGLRYLCNLFVLQTSRALMLQHASQLLPFLSGAAAAVVRQGRTARQAFCCLLRNFSVSLASQQPHNIEHATELCRLIADIMQEETDAQLFFHLVVAAGTLLCNNSMRQQLKQQQQQLLLQLQQLLPPLNDRVALDVSLGEAAEELLSLIG
ncbi:hypothetical protein Esti_003339 [Eimeria stiedai]